MLLMCGSSLFQLTQPAEPPSCPESQGPGAPCWTHEKQGSSSSFAEVLCKSGADGDIVYLSVPLGRFNANWFVQIARVLHGPMQ